MTTEAKDIETISAWLDGELSAAESARIEARVQSDAALSTAEHDMRQVGTLHRSAMREALSPVSLDAVASVKAAFAERRRRESRRRVIRAGLPIAASLMIVAGGAIWLQSKSAQYETERKIEIALMVDAAVQNALETAISGSEVALRLPNTRFDIRVTPTRTYRSASNHWCRDFTEHVVVNGEVVVRQATACRRKGGGWERVREPSGGGAEGET